MNDTIHSDPLAGRIPGGWDEARKARAKTAFYKALALDAHRFWGGKIQTMPRAPLPSGAWYNAWYTPGVSAVSTAIRDDNDLIYNLLLDFPTAALGGDIEIPTIQGTKLRVKMEPGTQPGKTLRLRGKGLPAVQGYGRGNGDLVVNVSVYVPKTLSREEKEAIEKFKQSDNFQGDAATKRSIFQRFKNYFS